MADPLEFLEQLGRKAVDTPLMRKYREFFDSKLPVPSFLSQQHTLLKERLPLADPAIVRTRYGERFSDIPNPFAVKAREAFAQSTIGLTSEEATQFLKRIDAFEAARRLLPARMTSSHRVVKDIVADIDAGIELDLREIRENMPLKLKNVALVEQQISDLKRNPNYRSSAMTGYFDGWNDPSKFDFRVHVGLRDENGTPTAFSFVTLRKLSGKEPQIILIGDSKVLRERPFCANDFALACAQIGNKNAIKVIVPTLADLDTLEHEMAHAHGKWEIGARLAESRFRGKTKEDALQEVLLSRAYDRASYFKSILEAFDGRLYAQNTNGPTFSTEALAWMDHGTKWKAGVANAERLQRMQPKLFDGPGKQVIDEIRAHRNERTLATMPKKDVEALVKGYFADQFAEKPNAVRDKLIRDKTDEFMAAFCKRFPK